MPERNFKIWENDCHNRLDKFAKKMLLNSTLSLIYSSIRKWKIKINNKKAKINTSVNVWDTVSFYFNDTFWEKLTKKEIIKIDGESNKLNSKNIIYEDKHLLIINKDAWLNVHPWSHKTKEVSLIQQVQDYIHSKNKNTSLTFNPSLVHRIDRDTSWAIIIALDKTSLLKMLDILQTNKLNKTYLTFAKWLFKNKTWKITKRLLRVKDAKNENKVRIDDKGQTAITHYKVIKEFKELWYSLVECTIETWRMHQIRVHLASLWYPIIWDKSYWDKKFNAFIKNNLWLTRQALHASTLEFTHPITKKLLKIKAEFKDDMKKLL